MCDCRERIEEELPEQFLKKNPGAQKVKADMLGYAIMFSGGVRPYMPVEITHEVTVKSTGLQKVKKAKMNMLFQFCPFCGEKQPG